MNDKDPGLDALRWAVMKDRPHAGPITEDYTPRKDRQIKDANFIIKTLVEEVDQNPEGGTYGISIPIRAARLYLEKWQVRQENE